MGKKGTLMSDLSKETAIHDMRISGVLYRLKQALDADGRVTLSSSEVESVYYSLNPNNSYNYNGK